MQSSIFSIYSSIKHRESGYTKSKLTIDPKKVCYPIENNNQLKCVLFAIIMPHDKANLMIV